MTASLQAAKHAAARAALELVTDGLCVGLGSGSTASIFIELLGAAVREGRFKKLACVPTSLDSEKLAKQAGINVVDFVTHARCDLTVDGADEIDPRLNVVKGLGGALLREKIVAQNSDRLVIIADETKLVSRIGERSPLPVEVVRFGLDASERFLRSLQCVPTLRKGKDGQPYLTDNGNVIFDCRFDQPYDVHGISRLLETRAGIVEHGLFLGMVHEALVATSTGEVKRLSR